MYRYISLRIKIVPICISLRIKNVPILIFHRATGGELFDRIVKKDSYSEADAIKVMGQLFSAVGMCSH